jgi:hypothetical protein
MVPDLGYMALRGMVSKWYTEVLLRRARHGPESGRPVAICRDYLSAVRLPTWQTSPHIHVLILLLSTGCRRTPMLTDRQVSRLGLCQNSDKAVFENGSLQGPQGLNGHGDVCIRLTARRTTFLRHHSPSPEGDFAELNECQSWIPSIWEYVFSSAALPSFKPLSTFLLLRACPRNWNRKCYSE